MPSAEDLVKLAELAEATNKLAEKDRIVKVGDDILISTLTTQGVETRPAKVVASWSKGSVNAVMFLDGSNDRILGGDSDKLTKWVTSVLREDLAGTAPTIWWNWPG